MLFSRLESMAQPCTDAKGRALKLGDRRWIIAQKQPYELLFVDARDDVMRLLALPLEGMEGEDMGVEGMGVEIDATTDEGIEPPTAPRSSHLHSYASSLQP